VIRLSSGTRVVPCGQKTGQTDEIRTDITKLIVGFRNIAKAPKNESEGFKIYIIGQNSCGGGGGGGEGRGGIAV
jgi:hypothetical protein